MSSNASIVDSVEDAKCMPKKKQPYEQLGLKKEEYEKIKTILKRRPTNAELAMYSVMWSEHCSYKSSKIHLKKFGELSTADSRLLVGIGENAGVVDVGDGWAASFKVESHNHPSYVEPYQGAATGVGGIVRDILSMGARPLAVMDSLRFGDREKNVHHVSEVIAGVGGYGNCLGLANIGGEIEFHPSYDKNPLVNALCVGVMKADNIHIAKASGVGNKVVLYGALTGGDGIGGVSVLASESFDSDVSKRPSVQVGDPFMEKLLIEATLELFEKKLIEGIQDLGGAGLSCATSELASNGTQGMNVALDRVPLRDATLTPEEILMSESQERMMAIVTDENVDAFLEVCEKWDVTAAVIGEVTDTRRLVITWNDAVICDVPPRTIAHDGPMYDRPISEPVRNNVKERDYGNHTPEKLKHIFLSLLSHSNLSSKEYVVKQYDRYVNGRSVLRYPNDCGVIRIDDESDIALALTLQSFPRFVSLDPYRGTQLSLAKAYRSVAASGAKPVAITNCLNYGSPEVPERMWEFARSVEGLRDGLIELEIPVTGGNVSFYNQTSEKAILPTPVIGVLGVLDDFRMAVSSRYCCEGSLVYLLGESQEEFGGSALAWGIYGEIAGDVPEVDLAKEKLLGEILYAGARAGMFDATRAVSSGGVGVALVRMFMQSAVGMRVVIPDGISPEVFLFGESAHRAIVVVSRSEDVAFTKLCETRGQAFSRIGVIDASVGKESTGSDNVDDEREQYMQVDDLFSISLREISV